MALGKRKPFNTKQRKRRILWERTGAIAGLLIALVCVYILIFYAVRLPFVTISGVIVEKTDTVSKDDIMTRTDTFLRGSYFGFIPHRFSFLLPLGKIRANLLEIPRVANVTFRTENDTLIVTVVEQLPDMLWCASAEATSTCFYVEKNGRAYEKAPELAGSTLMRFVVSGMFPKAGDALLNDRARSLLVSMAKIIEERHGFHVSRIEYTQDNDAVLYLSGGGKLLLSTDGNLEETYANLASVLGSDEYSTLTPGNFEYIDLRFGSKVFVQKEKWVASTTTSSTAHVE